MTATQILLTKSPPQKGKGGLGRLMRGWWQNPVHWKQAWAAGHIAIVHVFWSMATAKLYLVPALGNKKQGRESNENEGDLQNMH